MLYSNSLYYAQRGFKRGNTRRRADDIFCCIATFDAALSAMLKYPNKKKPLKHAYGAVLLTADCRTRDCCVSNLETESTVVGCCNCRLLEETFDLIEGFKSYEL
jgi:hypothetical protein